MSAYFRARAFLAKKRKNRPGVNRGGLYRKRREVAWSRRRELVVKTNSLRAANQRAESFSQTVWRQTAS